MDIMAYGLQLQYHISGSRNGSNLGFEIFFCIVFIDLSLAQSD